MTKLDDLNAEAYVETTIAALHELGGSATNAEILVRVADNLGLSEEELTRPYGDGSVTWLYYHLRGRGLGSGWMGSFATWGAGGGRSPNPRSSLR